MSKDLFKEFEPVSAKAFKQKIQVDLKGADYNEALVYKSHHGIDVKPFYHRENTQALAVKTPSKWSVCEQIYVADVDKTITHSQDVLNRGAEMLWLIVPNETIDIAKILEALSIDEQQIYIECEFLSQDYLKNLQNLQKTYKLKIGVDVIGHLAREGNWYHSKDEDHRILDSIISTEILSIDAGLYQNAGATIPQEIAYTLAHLNEYLNHFKDQKAFSFTITVSIGSNYFFEIAKLRALRALYKTLAKAHNVSDELYIIAQPTKRNKTLYDYNVNMLRTTTECMSGILGGANALCNMPYDHFYHKSNEFGSRIARNQLLVLKHESYFDMVNNPADGTYYIERLTQQFAEKGLELFKQLEKGGGLVQQLFDGKIQQKIEDSAQLEQQRFKDETLSLIGTNKYPNPEDKMANELELFPFVKKKPRKTLIQPIIERRLAEKLEQKRLDDEN